METNGIIKIMSVATFRKLGYLQEINRNFLHPRGLALEVEINTDGTEKFSAVWDYRDDPEGIIFDDSVLDDEFRKRASRIFLEVWGENGKAKAREEKLGYVIQPPGA